MRLLAMRMVANSFFGLATKRTILRSMKFLLFESFARLLSVMEKKETSEPEIIPDVTMRSANNKERSMKFRSKFLLREIKNTCNNSEYGSGSSEDVSKIDFSC